MPSDRKSKTPQQRMHRYRARLRASGLRPVQIWVPDTRRPNFAAEARRQSLLVGKRRSEDEALGFIEAVADFDNAS